MLRVARLIRLCSMRESIGLVLLVCVWRVTINVRDPEIGFVAVGFCGIPFSRLVVLEDAAVKSSNLRIQSFKRSTQHTHISNIRQCKRIVLKPQPQTQEQVCITSASRNDG